MAQILKLEATALIQGASRALDILPNQHRGPILRSQEFIYRYRPLSANEVCTTPRREEGQTRHALGACTVCPDGSEPHNL